MFCTFLKGGGIDCTRSAFVGLAWQAGELEEKYDGFLVSTGETSLLSSGPPGLHQVNLFMKLDDITDTVTCQGTQRTKEGKEEEE